MPSGHLDFPYADGALDVYTCFEQDGSVVVRSFDADTGFHEDLEVLREEDEAEFEARGRLTPELDRAAAATSARIANRNDRTTVELWFSIEESDLPTEEEMILDPELAESAEAIREERIVAAGRGIVTALRRLRGVTIRTDFAGDQAFFPRVIADVPMQHLRALGNLPGVAFVIDSQVDSPAIPAAPTNNYFGIVWDGALDDMSPGIDGTGVRVAIYEPGRPDSVSNLPRALTDTSPYACATGSRNVLCHCAAWATGGANATASAHARMMGSVISNTVGGVLAFGSDGIGGLADEADLMFANFEGGCIWPGAADKYGSALVWATAAAQQASVISASWEQANTPRIGRSSLDILHDYFVWRSPHPSMVFAAGNQGTILRGIGNAGSNVSHRTHNALVVGAADTRGVTARVNTIPVLAESGWENPGLNGGWELPHVVAPGADLIAAGSATGTVQTAAASTSVATAVVAAGIANLQERNPAVKQKPEVSYATMMVTADLNVRDSATSAGVWPLDLSDTVDDHDGAGLVNFSRAYWIMAPDAYRTGTSPADQSGHSYGSLVSSATPAGTYYGTTWKARIPPGSTLRAAAFVRAKPVCSSTNPGTSNCTNTAFVQYCLRATNAAGTVVAASCQYGQTYQFLSITNPSCTSADYNLRLWVNDYAGITSAAFGLAWDGGMSSCVAPTHCTELCGNNLDDNCDGLVDCAAQSCVGNTACAEDCSNGADDNRNTLIDCSDPMYCGAAPVCQPETCDDHVENEDPDALMDCADPDCCQGLDCAGPGGNPAACAEQCTGGVDEDLDGAIDCWDTSACGTNPACAEVCDNGLDDDKDGAVDCADANCQIPSVIHCRPEDCANETDDNGNGQVDCADADCVGTVACPASEDCTNGIDDDGDTLADCSDADGCGGEAHCTEGPSANCANGIDDNRRDGADCADPACAASAACRVERCDVTGDEDLDLVADCLDPDCAAYPGCLTELCTNGRDDDLDGAGDCSDPDCQGSSQHPAELCGNGIDDNCDLQVDEGCVIDGCDDVAPRCGIVQFSDNTTVACGCNAEEDCDLNTNRCVFKGSLLPPDPATLVNSADPVPENFADAMSFLIGPVHRSDNPAVELAALEPHRLAVVRGLVLDSTGQPVPGVRVSVIEPTPLGYTFSRADGWYDIVINGGGRAVLEFSRAGYLPVQREVYAEWESYEILSDVAMTRISPVATGLLFGLQAPQQLAVGETISDIDGERTAAVYIPEHTVATVNGAPITAANLRITEFTVGEAGMTAMPADLPETSMYTYAANFGFDGVAPGSTVAFTNDQGQPVGVPIYLDNFLDLPPGTLVPVGYYDYEATQWVPETDGVVLEVMGIEDVAVGNDRAILGVKNSGEVTVTLWPEWLTALGITDAEREVILSRYPTIGQTFWRAAVTHFSTYDLNLKGRRLIKPDDAVPPQDREDIPANQCLESGSVIHCQSRALSESVPIAGTSASLVYHSDRVRAYANSNRSLTLDLRSMQPPKDSEGHALSSTIRIYATILGRVIADIKVPDSTDTYVIEWDGRDAMGRTWDRPAILEYSVSYVLPASYGAAELLLSSATVGMERSFGEYIIGGSCDLQTDPCCISASNNPTAGVAFTVERSERPSRALQALRPANTRRHALGGYAAESVGLGGWTLSGHHAFAPETGEVFLSDGSVLRPYGGVGAPFILTGAQSHRAYLPEGGVGPNVVEQPASSADLFHVANVAVGPDGTVYFIDGGYGLTGEEWEPNNGFWHGMHPVPGYRIWAISPQGRIRPIWLPPSNWSGPGQDPTAPLRTALDLATPLSATDVLEFRGLSVGPDGALYVMVRVHDPYHANDDARLVRISGTAAAPVVTTVMGSTPDETGDCAYEKDSQGLFNFRDGTAAVQRNVTLAFRGMAVTDDGTLHVLRRPCSLDDPAELLTLRRDGTLQGSFAGRDFVHISPGTDNSLILVERINAANCGGSLTRHHIIWRRSADGAMEHLAGRTDINWTSGTSGYLCPIACPPGTECPYPQEGGIPQETALPAVADAGQAPDGTVYFLAALSTSTSSGSGQDTKLWRIGASGLENVDLSRVPAPREPASNGTIGGPQRLSFLPDGTILLGHQHGHRIIAIPPSVAAHEGTDYFVPSADGSEIYYFDATGRHTYTVDAITRETLTTFGYDAAGQLASVTDGDGRVLNISRPLSSQIELQVPSRTGAEAPYTTEVHLDGAGYVQSVTGPDSGVGVPAWSFQYESSAYQDGGLLTRSWTPRAPVEGHTYVFDRLDGPGGRPVLRDDSGPTGVRQTMGRTAHTFIPVAIEAQWCDGSTYVSAWSVTSSTTIERTDAAGRRAIYRTSTDPSGIVTARVTRVTTSDPQAPGPTFSHQEPGNAGHGVRTFPGGTLDYDLAPDPVVAGNARYLQQATLALANVGGTGYTPRDPLTMRVTNTRAATLDYTSPLRPRPVTAWTETTKVGTGQTARTSTTTYTASTRTTVSCSPVGRCTETTLDDDGRPSMQVVLMSDGQGGRVPAVQPTYLSYDARGNLARAYQAPAPLANGGPCTGAEPCVEYAYDDFDRLTQVRVPLAPANQPGVSLAQYDAWGTPRYSLPFDGTGAALSGDYALSIDTGSDGAPEGVITPGVASAGGTRDHRFAYDALGRATQYRSPSTEPLTPACEQGETCVIYGPGRDVQAVVQPDGSAITMGYEVISGRLHAVTVPQDGTYDPFVYSTTTGNLTSVTRTDTDGTTSAVNLEWQASLPTAIEWTGSPVTGRVDFEYSDSFLELNKLTVRRGSIWHAMTYGYDKDGLILTVADSASSGTAPSAKVTLVRDPVFGHVSTASVGRTTDTGYTVLTHSMDTDGYVPGPGATPGRGRYLGQTATVGGNPVFTTTYGYDLAGRITSWEEDDGTTLRTRTFTYDAVGRLTDVRVDGVEIEHYEYDANGNRTLVRLGGTSGTVIEPTCGNGLAATDDDRLCEYGDYRYEYDANGRLRYRTNVVAGGTTEYQYDAAGRLHAVSVANGPLVEYEHDALGRRVARRVDGALTKGWLYRDGLKPIAQLDASGNLEAVFVYASRAHVPDYMVRLNPTTGAVSQTLAFVSDHLGSVRRVYDVVTGALVQGRDYDAFGNLTASWPPETIDLHPFGFAGGLYDAETGLTRFGARDYEAETGRWTARDPIDFAGGLANLYSYVGSDPINYTDPSGLLFGLDAGEGYGESAALYWADVYNDSTGPTAWGAAVMGVSASAWTPCTSDETFLTLIGSFGGATYEGASWAMRSGVQSHVFRWGWQTYNVTKGVAARGIQKLHFHLGPVMKHHLPWQLRPWMYQTRSVVRQWWKNLW